MGKKKTRSIGLDSRLTQFTSAVTNTSRPINVDQAMTARDAQLASRVLCEVTMMDFNVGTRARATASFINARAAYNGTARGLCRMQTVRTLLQCLGMLFYFPFARVSHASIPSTRTPSSQRLFEKSPIVVGDNRENCLVAPDDDDDSAGERYTQICLDNRIHLDLWSFGGIRVATFPQVALLVR